MSVFYDIVKKAETTPGSEKDPLIMLGLIQELPAEQRDECLRGGDVYLKLSNNAPVWSPYIAEYDEQIDVMLAAG